MRAVTVALLLLSQSAVLAAILRRRLIRPFLFFFLYALVLVIRQARLSLLDPTTPAFLEFWALTLVFVIPLQILAAGESSYRSLEQFRGLRMSVFAGAAAVAVVLAVWMQDLQSRHTRYGMISQADQAVTTTLFLSGLAFTLGLSWIHPQRRRNALLHERLLVLHFGILAVSLFLLHRGQMWVGPVCTVASAAGFFAWALLIRTEGEQLPPSDSNDPQQRNQLAAGIANLSRVWKGAAGTSQPETR